jgi:L-ascorbate metabolism protein UlaG (beta-lactamase superfamily)
MLQPIQSIPSSFCIEPTITWIGHATFLIQVDGFNVITDPIFGDVMVGPLTLSKRALPIGVLPEHMPAIDAIVISHDHSDHTDTQTLTWLAKRDNPTAYVPAGNKALFESMGFTRIIEHTWWQTHTIEKNGKVLSIACLPARHWSIRFSLGSYRKSLWASWMIHTDKTYIYFAGDTAYGKHFAQIKNVYPHIDIALMPIAPTEEKENKHSHVHLDAPEAVQACIDLGARYFVPMHYGTFFMGKASLEWPLQRLVQSWQDNSAKLRSTTLLQVQCGKQYCL